MDHFYSTGQHFELKEDGKKEREYERSVERVSSQTERAEKARAMDGEIETHAETNSKEVRLVFILFQPLFYMYASLISLFLFYFQAGRRDAGALDPPPPPLQTDAPSAKKTKFRPPPLKNTTDATDK